MKIATVGTGNMARSVGGAWAEVGHDVFFGSRDEERGREAAATVGLGTRGGSSREAVAFADAVFYTPRSAPSEALSHPEALVGKVLIDCGNRPVPSNQTFGPPAGPSYAEKIAADVPGVKVVKAFNTMAQEVFHQAFSARRESGQCVFIAGDDVDAKRLVAGLIHDLGLEPLDCGPLAHAWLLESAGDLIRYLIFNGKGPFATFAVPALPEIEPRFGGRQASTYK